MCLNKKKLFGNELVVSLVDYMRVSAIFNKYSSEITAEELKLTAIIPVFSNFSLSCTSNTLVNYLPMTGSISVITSRPVEKNEVFTKCTPQISNGFMLLSQGLTVDKPQNSAVFLHLSIGDKIRKTIQINQTIELSHVLGWFRATLLGQNKEVAYPVAFQNEKDSLKLLKTSLCKLLKGYSTSIKVIK